jgi:hypothetical protein
MPSTSATPVTTRSAAAEVEPDSFLVATIGASVGSSTMTLIRGTVLDDVAGSTMGHTRSAVLQDVGGATMGHIRSGVVVPTGSSTISVARGEPLPSSFTSPVDDGLVRAFFAPDHVVSPVNDSLVTVIAPPGTSPVSDGIADKVLPPDWVFSPVNDSLVDFIAPTDLPATSPVSEASILPFIIPLSPGQQQPEQKIKGLLDPPRRCVGTSGGVGPGVRGCEHGTGEIIKEITD